MTMDDLIEYVISEDRVCPVPYKWKVVDETLRKVVDKTQSLKPPSSFILAAWGATSDRRKRARLIEQITFSHQVGKFDEIRSFLLSLNKDEWRYCPEAGLDAPTADDREMEEQEEIYDRIRQAKSFYEEFVKISGFSDCDQNKFRELLSTFMQIFLEKIDVQEKISELENKINSYKTFMEDLVRYEDDCSEFTLNFCSDQHRKNQEELLLCKILLCMQGGEKWAYGRERDFDDFLDDMFKEY